ncbi:MAG: hypothetical protein LCH69_06220 [Proteobacteria bacterium]|nr:hypothetical protein [Pseudomonadota bacterium]
MRQRILVISVLLLATLASGCGPLVVGAGGAVIADQAVEDEKGGDGLF